MMTVNRIHLAVLTCLLLLIPNAGSADKDLTHELYAKSGLKKQIELLPSNMQAQFAQDFHFQQMPREVSSEIKALVAQCFAAKNLEPIVLKHIEARMSPGVMRAVMDWLDSPLGKKCTKLEGAASTPEAVAGIQAFALELQDSPPSPDRLRLIRTFDAATRSTEAAVTITMNMELAIRTAFLTSFPPEAETSVAEIMEEIKRNQPQLEAMLHPQVVINLLYAYRSLSNSELEEYIEFATSDMGKNYHAATLDAIRNALLDASLRFGRSMVDLFRHIGKQSEA